MMQLLSSYSLQGYARPYLHLNGLHGVGVSTKCLPDYGPPFLSRVSFHVASIGVGMVTADVPAGTLVVTGTVTPVSVVVVVMSTELGVVVEH